MTLETPVPPYRGHGPGAEVLHAIEVEVAGLARSSLLCAAAAGSLTVEQLDFYVRGLRFLIGHTEPHLRFARFNAERHDLPDLADFFGHKLDEEQGHCTWADEDLAFLRRLGSQGAAGAPPGAAVEWVVSIARTIERDPRDYLAHIALTEYGTVILGPQFVEALEARCRIPKEAVSVIANHMVLDVEHYHEAAAAIDRFAAGRVRQLKQALVGFATCWHRLADEAIRHGASRPTGPAARECAVL